MPRIFISYRREDAAGHAGRMYDELHKRFGSSNVFIDVDSIRPGDDFVEAIHRTIQGCDVVLAIIGPRWLTAADAKGTPRLTDENDFVRLELEAALTHHLRVVPILVGRAAVPQPRDLPESLRPLLRRHAVELNDSGWSRDVEGLIQSLERIETGGRSAGPEPAGPPADRQAQSAPVAPVVPPDPIPVPSQEAVDTDVARRRRRTRMTYVIGAGVLLAVVAIAIAIATQTSAPCTENDPEACQAACAARDGAACVTAAAMYEVGTAGVTRNPATAAGLFEAGCTAGDPRACWKHGSMILREIGGQKRDVRRAIALFQKSCDAGDMTGCSYVGDVHGLGLDKHPVDRDKARALYQRACDGKSARGCAILSIYYFYAYGGLPKDEAQSMVLARRACDAGYGNGCRNLGYFYGQASAQFSAKEMGDLQRRACDAVEGSDCDTLGWCYETGKCGFPTDLVRAVDLYRSGCDQWKGSACERLGRMFQFGLPNLIAVNPQRAFEMYERSCEARDGDGCTFLGQAVEKGLGGRAADPDRAVALYRDACSLRAPNCNDLGVAYALGKGQLDVDPFEANRLYEIACTAGSDVGCANLGFNYRSGFGVKTIDVDRGLGYLKRSCDLGYAKACDALKEK